MNNKLSFSDLQEQQKAWVSHNFPSRKSYMPLLGAIEEIGELSQLDEDSVHLFEIFKVLAKMSHAQLKSDQKIRIGENHKKNIADGIADCVIFLADYCSAQDLDLQDIIEETWNKVQQRDWVKYPKNGGTE